MTTSCEYLPRLPGEQPVERRVPELCLYTYNWTTISGLRRSYSRPIRNGGGLWRRSAEVEGKITLNPGILYQSEH